MADALYPKWKEALLQNTANSDLDQTGAEGVYVALIDTAVYTYGAANEFWDAGGASDPIDALVGTAQELGTKTYADGLFDSTGTVTFSSVTGASCEALIIYRKNAGAETTHRLVAYLDVGVTGLPVTPNGGDITIDWDPSGVFQL